MEFVGGELKIGKGSSFMEALDLLYSRVYPHKATIVEIGTIRADFTTTGILDGHSTVAWGWYAKEYGAHVHTVDIAKNHLALCREVTKEYSDNITYVNAVGYTFLKSFEGKIDLLYLDGDSNHKRMPEEYAQAKSKLKSTSLILMDDICPDTRNAGKGKIIVPMLLKDGWKIVYHKTKGDHMNQMLVSR